MGKRKKWVVVTGKEDLDPKADAVDTAKLHAAGQIGAALNGAAKFECVVGQRQQSGEWKRSSEKRDETVICSR